MKATVVPMTATTSSVSLRVLVLDNVDRDPGRLAVRIDGRQIQLPSDGWRSFDEGGRFLRYRNCVVDGLAPGSSHEVELDSAGTVVGTCAATTLPAPDQPVGIVVGSCCADDGPLDDIEPNYRAVTASLAAEGIAPLNLWCGDQVYVDAPWKSGFLRADPRRVIFSKYLKAWGLQGLSAGQHKESLAYALSQGSNWFLPDDHEFWNGYPHPSFFTLPAHTAGRIVVQIYRRYRASDRPPHPAAQWSWARTAGETYCVFQSSADFGTFDESVNPPQVQTIDFGNAVVVIGDTRWHRTIRKGRDGSGFMRADDLYTLIKTLKSDRRLVCLALAKPIVGYLPHQGSIRTQAEYSPEDYVGQYLELWAALRDRAEQGWPTLVVGGDVHNQSIKLALDDRLLEIVSSPLAGLDALSHWHIRTGKKIWVKGKQVFQSLADRRDGTIRPDNRAFDVFPVVVGAPEDKVWQPARARRPVGDDPLTENGGDLSSGLVSLRIDAADPQHPKIRVATVARLAQPDGADADTSGSTDHSATHEFAWNGAWNVV